MRVLHSSLVVAVCVTPVIAQCQFETTGKQHLGATQTDRGFIVADLDGDQDVDLVNLRDGTLLRNDGSSVFTPNGFLPMPRTNALHIDGTAFDIDLDGDIDLFVALPEPRIYLQDQRAFQFVDATAGRISVTLPRAANARCTAVEHGDVNGDGYTDVVVDFGTSSPPIAFLNDGSGHFRAAGNPLNSLRKTRVIQLALADLDGDGDLDAVRSGEPWVAGPSLLTRGTVSYMWTGSQFRLSQQLEAGESGFCLGDFTGSSAPDIALSRGSGFVVLENTGTGVFVPTNTKIYDGSSSARAPSSADTSSTTLIAGDFNQDGIDDVVIGSTVLHAVHARVPGRVEFETYATPLPEYDVGNLSAYAADFDGSGTLDLLLSHGLLLLNQSRGEFVEANSAPYRQLSLGDLNIGDVVGNRDADGLRESTLMQSDEQGRWRSTNFLYAGASMTWSSFEDLDQDGDLDLVGFNGWAVLLLDNDGQGQFSNASAARFTSAVIPGSPLVVDVDGDGLLDLVTGNNAVTMNLGNGVFGPSTLMLASRPQDPFAKLTPIDVEGDGDIDFIERKHILLLNNGSAGFTEVGAHRLPFPFSAGSVSATGDLDGDGFLDIVVQEVGFGPSLALNNGLGTFHIAAGAFSPQPPSVFGAPTDIDADGDLDLNSPAGVYLNDGAGNFTLDRSERFENLPRAPLRDLDRDGDADSLVDGRVVRNLYRHVSAPLLPRAGRPYEMRIHDWNTGRYRIVQPVVGFREQLRTIDGIGDVLIDPATMFGLPYVLMAPHERTVLTQFDIPSHTRTGHPFLVQCAVMDLNTNQVRLTNVIRESVF